MGSWASGQEWEIKHDREGIKVSTRKSEGFQTDEFKAETVINAPMSELHKVVRRHSEMKNWFVRCLESKRLKKVSDNEYYVYTCMDAPWPVQDRDNVMHLKIENQADGSVHVYLKAVPDYIPKKKGRIRIPKMDGIWVIKPLANNQIKISQQSKLDLGGEVPDFIVKLATTDGPYKTLHNLRKRLEN